jgi:hypothetical protein
MRYVDAGIDDEEPFKKRPFFFGVFCGLMVGLAAGMYIGLLWYIWYFSDVAPARAPQALQPIIPKASAQQQQEQQEAGWLTYNNPLHGISLSYPADWKKEELGSAVFLYPPIEDEGTFSYHSFNIMTEIDTTGGVLTAKDKVTMDVETGTIMGTFGMNFTESSPTTLGGLQDAHKIVYVMGQDDEEQGNEFVTEEIVAKSGNTFYKVHFSAPLTGPVHDRIWPQYEQMVESVKITS